MRKNLTFLFFLIFALSSFSQSDSTKIAFIAYWSLGDSYNFKVTKTKKRWTNEKLSINDSIQYIANFKVIDSTEKSYTIQWSYNNFLADSYKENLNRIYEDKQAYNDIVNQYNVTNVIYKTDEYGEFLEIVNWKDISSLMSNLLGELERNIKLRKPDKINEIRQAIEPLANIYSSKEGIEQLIVYELQYFHFPFGSEYDLNEPYEYESELPNMVGGDSVKADAKLTIVETVREDFYCVLKEEAIINPIDTKRQVTMLFKKMGLEEDKAEELMKSAIFNITDLNYYQYYYDPGIPHRIYGSRKTILNLDNTKVENLAELEIELIYDE